MDVNWGVSIIWNGNSMSRENHLVSFWHGPQIQRRKYGETEKWWNISRCCRNIVISTDSIPAGHYNFSGKLSGITIIWVRNGGQFTSWMSYGCLQHIRRFSCYYYHRFWGCNGLNSYSILKGLSTGSFLTPFWKWYHQPNTQPQPTVEFKSIRQSRVTEGGRCHTCHASRRGTDERSEPWQ